MTGALARAGVVLAALGGSLWASYFWQAYELNWAMAAAFLVGASAIGLVESRFGAAPEAAVTGVSGDLYKAEEEQRRAAAPELIAALSDDDIFVRWGALHKLRGCGESCAAAGLPAARGFCSCCARATPSCAGTPSTRSRSSASRSRSRGREDWRRLVSGISHLSSNSTSG